MAAGYDDLGELDRTSKDHERDRDQAGSTGVADTEGYARGKEDCEMFEIMRNVSFRPHSGWYERERDDSDTQ